MFVRRFVIIRRCPGVRGHDQSKTSAHRDGSTIQNTLYSSLFIGGLAGKNVAFWSLWSSNGLSAGPQFRHGANLIVNLLTVTWIWRCRDDANDVDKRGVRPLPLPVRDPKDEPILAIAISGQADFLVTGDQACSCWPVIRDLAG